MTKLTTVELLMKARNRIKGRFTHRAVYVNSGGTERVCAIGALYDQGIAHLGGYQPTGYAVVSLKRRYPELDDIIRETGQCIGSEALQAYGLEEVPSLNDSSDEGTVLRFFDKAIEVAAKKDGWTH